MTETPIGGTPIVTKESLVHFALDNALKSGYHDLVYDEDPAAVAIDLGTNCAELEGDEPKVLIPYIKTWRIRHPKPKAPQLNIALLESYRGKAQLYFEHLPSNTGANSQFRRGMAVGTIKVLEMVLEAHGVAPKQPADVGQAFQELLDALKGVDQPDRPKRKPRK